MQLDYLITQLGLIKSNLCQVKLNLIQLDFMQAPLLNQIELISNLIAN